MNRNNIEFAESIAGYSLTIEEVKEFIQEYNDYLTQTQEITPKGADTMSVKNSIITRADMEIQNLKQEIEEH
jgi:flagellar capping protein FliD